MPEETEWEAALKRHGIIANDKNIQHDELVDIAEQAASKVMQEKSREEQIREYTNVRLDEEEDEIEEDLLEKIRKERLKQLQEKKNKSRFGTIMEITASDYVKEVNEAGEGVFVVLHLYQDHVQICRQINEQMGLLAKKFPYVKFIKTVATDCIKNYPDHNVPTIFIHKEGTLLHSVVGQHNFAFEGGVFSMADLTWLLSEKEVLDKEDRIANPRQKKFKTTHISNILFGVNKNTVYSDEEDDE